MNINTHLFNTLGHDKAPYGASFSATCTAEGWVAGAHCTRCNKMRDSGLTVTVGAGTTVVDSNGTALIPEAICEGKANLHYFIPGNEGHNFGDDGKCRSCYKTKEELGLA